MELLYTLLIGPIWEEYIFRYKAIQLMYEFYIPTWAIYLIITASFSLLHGSYALSILPLSALLTSIRLMHTPLPIIILLHMLWNLCVLSGVIT